MVERLKPTGLPYGENGPAAERQREAGLPTSAPILPATPTPAAPARVPGDVSDAPMSDDPLMMLSPSTPLTAPVAPRDQLRAIAERSVNPLMRLIAENLAQE